MRRPSGNLKLCVDANMQAVSGGVPMPRQQLFWGFENWADLANCGRYVQSSFTSLESSGEFLDGVGTAELPRASLIPQAFYDFMSDDEEIGARRSGGPKLSVEVVDRTADKTMWRVRRTP
ncbi:hypothetical protein AXG93_2550s1310 [Marchantia polymorpha subsp. ruderalis]|uniref:Uncharacterized protein n=1 Tax=Marchantia polymorpha subsp. ruderalis TaxID=1480154 RepID=A0A176VMZ3_MARPO|nr:hypothetical protein AXG93_2550s1310 [Marchantia polymorpha subsp. ruderalis]